MIRLKIYQSQKKLSPLAAAALKEYGKRLSRQAKIDILSLKQAPGEALCFSPEGKPLTSPQLAEIIQAKLQVSATIHFKLAAGPDNYCLTSLPLSADMSTVLLLEQIYRSFKILAGEPYHK